MIILFIFDAMTECSPYYPANVPSCASSIAINGNFAASTAHTVRITDKFGNVYKLGYTTNADGLLTIDTADLPSHLLNPYAGVFEVEVFEGTDCTAKTMTLCEADYTAIGLTVVNELTDSTEPITATIPCC